MVQNAKIGQGKLGKWLSRSGAHVGAKNAGKPPQGLSRHILPVKRLKTIGLVL